MNKIRIKNLRSLKDTGYVDLKPLTILVGKNSSGKSTFLRAFPLIRQTIETQTNEPMLWYSPRYVDFGSFIESLNKTKDAETIEFEFEFSKLYKESLMLKLSLPSLRHLAIRSIKDLGVFNEYYKLLLKIEFDKDKFKRIEIKYEDHKVLIIIESTNKCRLFLNDVEIKKEIYFERNETNKNLLPLRLFVKGEKKYNDEKSYLDFINRYSDIRELFMSEIIKKLSEYSSCNISEDDAFNFVENTYFGRSDVMLHSMKKQKIENKVFGDYINNMHISCPEFFDIKNAYIGMNINRLLVFCNRSIESSFSSVKYIAPARAHAERYYRVQGLSVDEIDSRGENIAMLLYNMKGERLQKFNKWLIENIGFSIESVQEGGHVSIKIEGLSNEHTINLADSGFGYSQVLPILLTVWLSIEGRRHKRVNNFVNVYAHETTIVIEQPELHLHPSFQASVIDIFAKTINIAQRNKINLKIILETHSETILNRIGYLIAKQNISDDLVNVLIFDKNSEYETKIKSTGYSKRGRLIDWPIGFFSPEEI